MPPVNVIPHEDNLGVAVKDAMNALGDSQQSQPLNSVRSESLETEKNPGNEENGDEKKPPKSADAASEDCEIVEIKEHPKPMILSTSDSKTPTEVVTVTTTVASTVASTQSNATAQSSVVSTSTTTMPSSSNSLGAEVQNYQNQKQPAQYLAPPPAYRTASLVFKLLQIGSYQIRSYSEMNPNRLRVLFNTQ